VGSKVERVKRRRVMKRKRAQMDMVDWALEIIALEVLLLLMLDLINEGEEAEEEEEDVGGGGGGGDEEGEEEEEEEKRVILSTMGWLSSWGKKTRSKPMPQFSLLWLLLLFVSLALAFADSPISLSHSRLAHKAN